MVYNTKEQTIGDFQIAQQKLILAIEEEFILCNLTSNWAIIF